MPAVRKVSERYISQISKTERLNHSERKTVSPRACSRDRGFFSIRKIINDRYSYHVFVPYFLLFGRLFVCPSLSLATSKLNPTSCRAPHPIIYIFIVLFHSSLTLIGDVGESIQALTRGFVPSLLGKIVMSWQCVGNQC
jgi:hypothetical protein